MLWHLLSIATVASSLSVATHDRRPRLIRDSSTSISFKPSCGSLDSNSFAAFQSRPDTDVDAFAGSLSGRIAEDGITLDSIDPSRNIINIVARSSDGLPIFHTINLAPESEAATDEPNIFQVRSECTSCHEPMCKPACEPPLPQSCAFYSSCAEASLHCGDDGYPLRYGYKNCRAFVERLSHFSDDGQIWIWKVMTCLQQALLQPLNEQCNLTCDGLSDAAFDSHPKCYADSGVCFLPFEDLVQVVVTVGSDLFYGPALEQALGVGGRCVGKYIDEAEESIQKAKEAGDFAKRVVYEGVKKFLEAIE